VHVITEIVITVIWGNTINALNSRYEAEISKLVNDSAVGRRLSVTVICTEREETANKLSSPGIYKDLYSIPL